MHVIRTRVKEHFPSVLLTMLSIVQALALELLWAHLHAADYLYAWSWFALLAWGQISATLITMILIWVVYAGNVMRFRWVPAIGDSVVPFVIGLLEFMMIETLSPERLGHWLIYLALIYAAMVWTSQVIMRRARADGDNSQYFDKISPARSRDFYPEIILVCGIIALGIYIGLSHTTDWLAILIVIITNAFLLWRFHNTATFWNLSVSDS